MRPIEAGWPVDIDFQAKARIFTYLRSGARLDIIKWYLALFFGFLLLPKSCIVVNHFAQFDLPLSGSEKGEVDLLKLERA